MLAELPACSPRVRRLSLGGCGPLYPAAASALPELREMAVSTCTDGFVDEYKAAAEEFRKLRPDVELTLA